MDSFDILDQQVEDLHDLPEFKPWPTGSYMAELTTEIEQVEQDTSDGGTRNIELPVLVFKFRDVLELANPNDEPPNEKSSIYLRTYLVKKDGTRNEFGEGQLKLVLLALKDMYPEASTNRELIEQSNGTIVALTTKVRRRKNRDTGEIIEENQLLSVANPNED